jgi:hypothetical protein
MKRSILAALALCVVAVSGYAFAQDDKAKCTAKCTEALEACKKKAGSDPLKTASCAKDAADCTGKCDKDKKK